MSAEEEPQSEKLPAAVEKRIAELQQNVQRIGDLVLSSLTQTLPEEISFRFENAAPEDIFTEFERAQSISFVLRYPHLPHDFEVKLGRSDDQVRVLNYDYLRHVLNDYRCVVQNQRDPIFYKKIHNTWRRFVERTDSATGTAVTVYGKVDGQKVDITDDFLKCIDQSHSAVGKLLDQLELDYLYNGVLQHSDARFSRRFITDHHSGELNYMLIQHAHLLTLVAGLIEPYFLMANSLIRARPLGDL